MPTISVNDATIYYEERGEGPAVLFVHGMCGNADVWRDQVDRLSDAFRCVAYDRRGHTRSTLGGVEQRSVELHADDDAALIRALDLAPCLLVGSSSGARIGLDVARRSPELLRGAVLSEPPLFALDPEGGAQFMADVRPRVEDAMRTGGPPAAVDAFLDFVAPGLLDGDERRRAAYHANAGELLPDLQMPPYVVTAEDLAALRVPCLALRGDRSHALFMRIVDRLAAAVPGAERVVLGDANHSTYVDQPRAFSEAVRSFAMRHASVATR